MIALWLPKQLQPCWNCAYVDCVVQPCAIRTLLYKSSRLSVAGDLHLLRSVGLVWHFPRMLNGQERVSQTACEGNFIWNYDYESPSLIYICSAEISESYSRDLFV